ncbi:MAG: NADH-quinone oxidoreductase subunit M [Caldilinea sp.]|uniref:NADH-quinone oxidoreductase subunit M n=1 Tax=Caldilinea sp. TaxID=2293560 RepID=UPI002C84FE27|nr:NADH-quinone oxidoreductase subunit M [Caldilinea sp.]HRA68199.1 NADH-quinone oxidoreductase subunit M [Caldilinea sp.]
MALSIPYLLTIITFLPLLGAAVVMFAPGDGTKKWLALATTLVTFVVSLLLWTNWQQGEAGMQFVEDAVWFAPLGIRYTLGVDGISLFLVLLTTFLTPIAVYFSILYVDKRIGPYMALMLLLETAMIGVFLALDLVLFFVFFEASLIPMYFLIGEWGGQKRIYAAVKFFLYTFAGSALMVVAILIVYFSAGTFDIVALQSTPMPVAVQTWAFLAFSLAFAVKTPLFPFHTWLPDAHVQAPTAGSIILAGVLLKMGAYGFLRLAMPIFPQAAQQFGPLLATLAIVGILYGALVALMQKDLKALVAYSSVAHLGYVMLGVIAMNAQGVSGSVLQMVNHGLSTGALFLMVGLLYERRHTRMLDDFGGLWASVPVYTGLFLVVAMSSAGLPGLNGFVGEFTIMLGAYNYMPIFAVLAAAGVILAAWYLLTAFRKMAQGEITNPANDKHHLKDLNFKELVMVVPLVILFFVIGLFPNLFFDKINPSVEAMLETRTVLLQQGTAAQMPSLELAENVVTEAK